MRLLFPFLLLVITGIVACRKTQEITTDKSVKLSFSLDTVLFDTVFTSAGSANKRIKIYNTSHHAIAVSNIKLGNGINSPFSLIINGSPTNQKADLQIDGDDSISVFVKVTIDPNDVVQPFIVQDSILFSTNGNKQTIPLIAYGQNAVFINNKIIQANTGWTNNLPYIIYKSVTVAQGATLKIQAGTKIYFHGNSAMHIKGTLIAEGNKLNPIVFAGDRLERMYEDEPGQWTGIHFYNSSSASSIHFAVISNAITGLTVNAPAADNQPKLSLSSSIIKNMVIAGMAGYKTDIAAFNNLFFNCGQYLFYAVGGGRYNLKQNTFAGYNLNFARKTPAVYFSDTNDSRSGNLQITLVNNIIWGTLTEEFLIDKKTNATVDAEVRNNLIKTALQIYNDPFNILNADPLFIDSSKENFGIQASSPALNKGENLSSDPYFSRFLNKDLDNNIRLFPSEIGCYEKN